MFRWQMSKCHGNAVRSSLIQIQWNADRQNGQETRVHYVILGKTPPTRFFANTFRAAKKAQESSYRAANYEQFAIQLTL